MSSVLTIVLCTRNRAGLLDLVLDDLSAQARTAGVPWELLVVDNGSTDDTERVLEARCRELPLRRVYEPRAGLSIARNRALAEATTDVVVFTDDDVRLEPGWLSAWAQAIASDEAHGWFGGRVEPEWPTGRPGWLVDERLDLISGVLNWHALPDPGRPYRDGDPLPIGANFGLRRRVAQEIGPFREDLGVSGESRGRGEDTEWLLRARRAGHRGLYVGTAAIRHPIPADRLRLGALWRHGVESGVAHSRIHGYQRNGSRWQALSFLARGARQWLLGRGDRFRQCVINAGIEAGLRRVHRAAVSEGRRRKEGVTRV